MTSPENGFNGYMAERLRQLEIWIEAGIDAEDIAAAEAELGRIDTALCYLEGYEASSGRRGSPASDMRDTVCFLRWELGNREEEFEARGKAPAAARPGKARLRSVEAVCKKAGMEAEDPDGFRTDEAYELYSRELRGALEAIGAEDLGEGWWFIDEDQDYGAGSYSGFADGYRIRPWAFSRGNFSLNCDGLTVTDPEGGHEMDIEFHPDMDDGRTGMEVRVRLRHESGTAIVRHVYSVTGRMRNFYPWLVKNHTRILEKASWVWART